MAEGRVIPWTIGYKKLLDQISSSGKNVGYHDRYLALDKASALLGKEMFHYKNASERYQGCLSLLKCGNYLLDHVDGVPFKDRKLFFISIIQIIHRREFDVKSFAILHGNGGMAIACSKKMEDIMTQYRDFLYKNQYYSHKKLASKGQYAMLTAFCLSVTAINYCFIGRVTSMVLNTLVPGKKESLKDPDNITIMLNKLLEEQAEADTRSTSYERNIEVFCNYKWAFGELPDTPLFKKLEATVKENSDWLAVFNQDPVNRYRFISELVNYAAYLTNNQTQWSLLFGYFDILHPFFTAMVAEAPDYSKNVISLSKTLLYNPRLLNLYLTITLEKTNLYDTSATLNTLQRMSEWFYCIRVKHRLLHLPDYIDFTLIHKALSILLLENEHYNTLLTALTFVYKFFLHWNADARIVFHHIIVYKVFSFEVASGSLATNTILPTGNEPILQRSLVTDDNHFQAVKNKISIIKKLMSRPDKAGLDPDLRLLMPYAAPSLSEYRSALESYNDWRQNITLGNDGSILYPNIKCSAIPDG